MVETPAPRDVLLLAAAATLALLSALAVVYSVHVSRQLVNELQALQRDSERMQVQWGQLLLEKSTWGSYAHVEQTARTRLNMYLPTVQEIVVTGQ
ncbi:MAG: cell division protein FtsL [Pseudomonadota bacterium]